MTDESKPDLKLVPPRPASEQDGYWVCGGLAPPYRAHPLKLVYSGEPTKRQGEHDE